VRAAQDKNMPEEPYKEPYKKISVTPDLHREIELWSVENGVFIKDAVEKAWACFMEHNKVADNPFLPETWNPEEIEDAAFLVGALRIPKKDRDQPYYILITLLHTALIVCKNAFPDILAKWK
jgi:hypothetical protein